MRVAVLDDYQDVALTSTDWSALPPDVEVTTFRDHLAVEDALAARLQDFDAIVAMRERTPFPRSLLSRLPKLRLLITTGRRNAVIDVAAANEAGITVCGTLSVGYPTAELTWGLILALTRRIPQEDAAIRAGKWQTSIGPGLRDKVLGIMGLGNQGSWVAGYGKAFGMEVIAWSQNLTAERAAERGANLVTKEELLRRSDVLTIHLVLSDRTRGIVGADELAMMKPSAYLINTSRGPIVDELALARALEDGTIAGAGIDVFDVEPLAPDHPLLRAPNTVLTPHIGYVSTENSRVFFDHIVEDIKAFLEGKPVRVIEP